MGVTDAQILYTKGLEGYKVCCINPLTGSDCDLGTISGSTGKWLASTLGSQTFKTRKQAAKAMLKNKIDPLLRLHQRELHEEWKFCNPIRLNRHFAEEVWKVLQEEIGGLVEADREQFILLHAPDQLWRQVLFLLTVECRLLH